MIVPDGLGWSYRSAHKATAVNRNLWGYEKGDAVRPRARAGKTARELVDAFVRPQLFRAGHFYSPVNSREDIERALNSDADIPGVELREADQVALFNELVPLFGDVPERRFKPNGMFGGADASVYQAIVRRFKPRRVVEVGAGFSTARLLDTAEAFLPELQITCIEPYPDRLLALLEPNDRVELIAAPVQDVPISTLVALESSDILFIDSTHVAKAGSDVVWLLLRVLPRLQKGVLVHIHDVFWPFEYPGEWLRAGRSWNEDYFLHAFLCHNDAWSIELFSSWVWHHHSGLVPDGLRAEKPGSIWLRRR